MAQLLALLHLRQESLPWFHMCGVGVFSRVVVGHLSWINADIIGSNMKIRLFKFNFDSFGQPVNFCGFRVK